MARAAASRSVGRHPATRDAADAATRKHVEVRGTVQGVGFRPFVYRLATSLGLAGWVRNRSSGVEIEIEGRADALAAFLDGLRAEPPPLARIERVESAEIEPIGETAFEIRASQTIAGQALPVPPDTAPCEACLRELFDPTDRRYYYPFNNCTNCGPRFTIIEALPYDRPATTMRAFPMCAACEREYHDPLDRRFHAQPVACPACGPRLWIEGVFRYVPSQGSASAPGGDEAIGAAVALLRDGRIVAIKGLGGFHLACDARNEGAVARLRERKRRGAKPFAVMFRDLAAVRAVCDADEDAAASLTGPARPIVLLPTTRPLAPSVAPGLRELGAMLPSTPLHELLMRAFGGPLVMTSGNLAEEPIAADNDEARRRLGHIADAFLLHDRPIASRYDDSVVRPFEGSEVVVRRARGLAPRPLELSVAARQPILATGAHLKNTFCLLKDRHAFVSQHVGDLESVETLEHWKRLLALYEKLFEVRPAVVAHDLHPDYLSTKLALDLDGVERIAVQHHHAHVVSCLAEHGVRGPAIGVTFDGLGYGSDGHLWGGEVLVADWRSFERRAHLREAPMPGGASAVRRPSRMALGYLYAWLPDELETFAPFLDALDLSEARLTRTQVDRGLNAPLTSSCGRLFDAVAALLGVCSVARYEGQAAMELQALADPAAEGSYPYAIRETGDCRVVDPAPTILAVFRDHQGGVPLPTIAMRFHRTVAEFTADVCGRLAAETGLRQVALAGGVFQNHLLLGEIVRRLRAAGLDPIYPRQLPANDGGLSFGQAIVAQASLGGDTHG